MLRQFCRLAPVTRKLSPLSLQLRMASSEGGGRLAGKVAIVTASTDGIGLAIARRLGEDGAKVMISSRKQANVDTAVTKLSALNLRVAGTICHVAKAADRTRLIQETLRQFGGVDILVSNAAANPYYGSLLDTPEEAWDKIFDTNVKATFMLCKEIVPHMEKRGSGAIILVASIGGFTPLSSIGAYSISKTALLGMTKGLAPELTASNIRINCLAPGIIKTNFSRALWENEMMSEVALRQIPMGRLGSPEDCAGVVSFLVSDDAAYITGETVVVAGGMTSRL